MAFGEIPNNLIPNEPSLTDVLSYHRKGIFLDFNCHHVGMIESFNGTNQTAKVTINYKKTYFKPNAMGVVKAELRDYPIIVDAPVIFLGGGGFSLTFPVSVGDECLVLFNDRDIDAWFAGSSSSANPTGRLHSFADAFVLVGIRSLPKLILSPDGDGAALRNRFGTSKVLVLDDGVTITSGLFGTTAVFDSTGKLSISNLVGEFVAALNTILKTATAAGFPLVIDPVALATLESFEV